MADRKFRRVLVTGGAGYVGAMLVPALLREGYEVTVFDLYLFGDDALRDVKGNSKLREIKGDLRDTALVDQHVQGCDAVIHLACISNDPSFELNPVLGKSINYDAFVSLVDICKRQNVKRFIYASSSSVYGVKEDENVTEDLSLDALTDYSKYKAECERVLLDDPDDVFTKFVVRPATVCGYSPRQRLDLTVNILTNHAVNGGKITVFGGDQMRPNLHIKDMVQFYINALTWEHEQIHRKIYNVGYENLSVQRIAELVRDEVDPGIEIVRTPTDDMRSYRISSEKIKRELGFVPRHTVKEAISDLVMAFKDGLVPDPMNLETYYNIRRMKSIDLQ